MSVRMVNVVPNVRIKTEVVEVPDEDDEVACKVCGKGFASEMAVRNHVRVEHIELYLQGDESSYMQRLHEGVPQRPPTPRKKKVKKDIEKVKKEIDLSQMSIRVNTERLLSSMGPQNLMSLASEDVSYIIIKTEDDQKFQPSASKRRKEMGLNNVVGREKRAERESRAITGPFECLQPSNLVADGTCHQIFFSCCDYSAHYRDEHTRRRKGHRCQVCERPLRGEDAAPFACDVCGAGFNSNKDLAEHTSTAHVKLKPFECSVCHKRFTQQGGVQQHMRMHTGDRPYSCTFCPKAFTQKSGLEQHLRIHTKVKPYRCIICLKAFCQSVHLKQHMRTHTNVSPFQCGVCQKRFKQSSHLNYHLKNHNPANMTAEQQQMYAELVGRMQADSAEQGNDQAVIVEQGYKQEEQVMSEEYVLSDGVETWSVQFCDKS